MGRTYLYYIQCSSMNLLVASCLPQNQSSLILLNNYLSQRLARGFNYDNESGIQ